MRPYQDLADGNAAGQERPGSAGPGNEAAIRTPDRRLRVFVSSSLEEPGLVLSGIGRAVGADWAGTPLDAVAERLGDEQWLLVLDNLEQVVGAAADLGQLLARCPGG